MFRNIQYLRGIAALLVTIGHNLQLIREKVYSSDSALVSHFENTGAIGVDIFFVISGFIMLYVSGQDAASWRSARLFWAKRVCRVMPMYWIFTSIVLAFYLSGIPKSTIDFSAYYIGRSYLLLPLHNQHGDLLPILSVGWTLIYEMFFYFVFGLLLLTRSSRRVWGLSAAMLGLVLLGWLLPAAKDGSVVFSTYTSPMLLEFLYGIWIAKLWLMGYRMPRPLALVLLVVAFVLLSVWYTGVEATRPFWSGIPAAFVVAAAMTLEAPGKAANTLMHRSLKTLGDASYSLYLIHPVLLYGVSFAVRRLPTGTPGAAMLVFVLAMALQLIAALWFFRHVESPVTESLHRRFFKRTKPAVSAPAA